MKTDDKKITYQELSEERKYGFYWYSGLWNVLRPLLVALTVAVAVVGLVFAGYNKIYGDFFAAVDTADSSDIGFTVSSGQSLSGVANRLEQAGLIRSRTVFKYYCDFAGMGQKIQTGTYVLNKGMTMLEIADRLTTGDGNPIVRNITLIPGETIEDFAEKLFNSGVIRDRDSFLALCRTGEAFSDYYYIDDVRKTPNIAKRRYVLEGYLAPDTYEVYTNASDESIIRKLLSQTEAVFPAESQERAAELGYTMDQILTMASLIEKESGSADFKKVSAVFHNRLRAGMKLQSDVTIHYITGVRKMALEENDLEADSLYNTYLYGGLPLGPICNPSAAAINAALYPDEAFIASDYHYFCAKEPDSGELYFSRTLWEHEQAVKIYAPLWQAYDEARGIK